MAWENIKENIKTSAKERVGQYELKQHNPWLSIKIFRSKEAVYSALVTGSKPN